MKAIEFPEANTIYAKNQPEYLGLPSLKTSDGIVTACYKPTIWEVIQLIFGAKVWLTVLTFNKPLQPQRMVVGWKVEPFLKPHVSERIH